MSCHICEFGDTNLRSVGLYRIVESFGSLIAWYALLYPQLQLLVLGRPGFEWGEFFVDEWSLLLSKGVE